MRHRPVIAPGYGGSYPSGQRGLTVNQLAEAFVGSNPTLPTQTHVQQRATDHSFDRQFVTRGNLLGLCV